MTKRFICLARLTLSLLLALAAGVVSRASAVSISVNWFNSSTNRVAYADGITPLAGDTVNVPPEADFSCLAQFIWSGQNDAPDPAVNTGDGVSGDDQVIATSYIAHATWEAGTLAASTDDIALSAEHPHFFVRLWNAPSPNYGLGSVPSGAAVRYGNSATWQAAEETSYAQDFDFGGVGDGSGMGFGTTLTAVPEARPLAMLSMAVLIVLRVLPQQLRRLRKETS